MDGVIEIKTKARTEYIETHLQGTPQYTREKCPYMTGVPSSQVTEHCSEKMSSNQSDL